MKRQCTVLLLAALVTFLVAGCEDQPVTQGQVESTVAKITGKIIDRDNSLPLAGVAVSFTSTVIQGTGTTMADGTFSIDLDLADVDASAVTGILSFRKDGYKDQERNFTATAGQTNRISLDAVSMERDTITTIGGGTLGGRAHTFAFISASAREISVYGVGGVESSIITFEVRDSLGFPITIDRRDTVTFQILGTPVQGGAYVSPLSAITNAAGRVATTVNSGTVSGVLQFIARLRRDSDGRIIQSTPVIITVNAGLPSQVHFTVAPAQFNFAGYNWLGRENAISVQVGDKYSNPVKLGTAVYFNTTGGIVEASIFTDLTGHGTNILYSGNPLPRDPRLSPPSLFGDGTGYAWVRAYTLGESGGQVTDSVLVLFSGVPTMTLSAYSFTIPRGRSTTIAVNISDQNDNPLAPGTRIKTETIFAPPEGTNWAATASGLPDDPFDDYLTRGPGRTDFTLRIADGTPGGTPDYMPVVVKISVTGPNGSIFTSISGSVGDTLSIAP